MRTFIALVLLAGATGCYESLPFGDDSPDGSGDTVHDTVLPDTSEPDDAGTEEAPFCGDEKEPRAVGSPIVNGVESFDPEVVRLGDGQVLAIGAMLQSGWGGDWSNVCTATLVTPTVVLTAAHCVQSWGGTVDPSEVRFGVGGDMADPVNVFEVVEVHANPAYRPRGDTQARGDQAVLILAQPATDVLPEIRPIPINREPPPDGFVGSRVQNVGFGSTTTGGGGDNTVRWWTTEEVVDLTDYDYTVNGGGVSSVCFGDSGGPGLWTFEDGAVRVAGTVSWGDPSCVDNDHFARTDFNLDFLYPFVGDEPVDPCGGLTWEGACEGNTAVWCVEGVTYRRDCAACGQMCGDAGPSLGFYCL